MKSARLQTAVLFCAALCASSWSVAFAGLTDGLVAHLPLISDLRDHAATPHPVEIVGKVDLQDGAALFGGDGDWLELPFIPLNDRAFAVAAWLRPAAKSLTNGLLLQYDKNVTDHILHLMIRDGLRPWLGFYVNDVVSPVSLSNDGAWQHVIFQYDGSRQQIWINGRLVISRLAAAYEGTSGKTCIGRNPGWNNVGTDDYRGAMGDFRIYDRALTFEEIKTLSDPAAAPKPPASRGLTAGKAGTGVKPATQAAGSVAPPGASDKPLLSLDAEKMRLRGKPGTTYIMEVSEDLAHWRPLKTVNVNAEGVADLIDEDAGKYRQRFYRIRYERAGE